MNWSLPIIIIPFIGFVFNLSISKSAGFRTLAISGVLPIVTSFFILIYFVATTSMPPEGIYEYWYSWLDFGFGSISISFYWDSLSILMTGVILGIGSLIHIYSIGYMAGHGNIGRYFSYMNLFIFFMLLLVLSSNMLGTFIGWEGVGLCSYLLIGYYYNQKDAIHAAPKAFIMNRFGDWGFIVAMLIIFSIWHTLDYAKLSEYVPAAVSDGSVSVAVVSAICLFIFWACCGKSAQFPLFTWLPDAMAGPTPVSALIHAATMVTSGIYLVVRMAQIFVLAQIALEVILYVGAATALIGALIALKQWDIKKVLAYSTVSQLGFMFMALGVTDFNSAMFHLTTHAFFKALLFLASGLVILQMHHQQDMREYSGLRTKLNFSFKIFMIGAWAIAGLPFGAGFFSKDEILVVLYQNNLAVWLIAVVASLLTAFYIYRLIYLTFFHSSLDSKTDLGEIPAVPLSIYFSLAVIGIGTLVIGFFGLPHTLDVFHIGNLFEDYLASSIIKFRRFSDGAMVSLGVALLMAIGGWLVARIFYLRKTKDYTDHSNAITANGFYLDQLYQQLIVSPAKILAKNVGLGALEHFYYQLPIYTGRWLVSLGQQIGKLLQRGQTSDYLLSVLVGLFLAVLILSILIFR